MAKIKHRFLDHKINPLTETLVVGTFNPETPENVADFFYGRQRNFLWTLIPTVSGKASLKGKDKNEKLQFIQEAKIDFIDLISEVDVYEVSNYNDDYLDDKVTQWRNVIAEIEQCPNIKRVCLTRKSFAGIPNMRIRIEELKEFCAKKGIVFQPLATPARFYNQNKQAEWSKFFTEII